MAICKFFILNLYSNLQTYDRFILNDTEYYLLYINIYVWLFIPFVAMYVWSLPCILIRIAAAPCMYYHIYLDFLNPYINICNSISMFTFDIDIYYFASLFIIFVKK